MALRPYGMVILVLLLLLAPAEAFPVPGLFDWSPIQTIIDIESTGSRLPPVTQDTHGNYHVSWFDGKGHYFSKDISPQGTELTNIKVLVPGLEGARISTGFKIPGGQMIIWGYPDDDLIWHLYYATIDYKGSLLDLGQLDFELPGGSQFSSSFNFRTLTMLASVQGTQGKNGLVHLLLLGGNGREMRYNLLTFTQNLVQIESAVVDTTGPNINTSSRARSASPFARDEAGYIYVLTTDRGNVSLTSFSPRGNRQWTEYLGATIYSIGGNYNNPYVMRGIPPSLALDDQGKFHIVWSHLSQVLLTGPPIVDVMYVQFTKGEPVRTQIISDGTGTAHFPTISYTQGNVYIVWEQSLGNRYELFYSRHSTDGTMLQEPVRLTWENSPSRLGKLWADPRGKLSLFWWRGGGSETQMAFKSTHNPIPPSMLHRFGIITGDVRNPVWGQVAHLVTMVITYSALKTLTNFKILICLAAVIFLLHKTDLLEIMLNRPKSLLCLCILSLYLFSPPITSKASAIMIGPGYTFFSAVAALGLLYLGMKLMGAKVNNSVSLFFCCAAWLLLMNVFQLIPVVPFYSSIWQ